MNLGFINDDKSGFVRDEVLNMTNYDTAGKYMDSAYYLSEFCDVFYVEEKNVVLVHWEKYCELEEYRKPLECALKVIEKFKFIKND